MNIKQYNIKDKELLEYIKKFNKVMHTGYTSSPILIKLAINSFIESYKIDKEITLRDIKCLIDIKNNNPKFRFIRTIHVNSCFEPKKEVLYIKDLQPIVFNHELTHALHCYLCHYYVPLEIVSLIPDDIDSKILKVFINKIIEIGNIIIPSEEELNKRFKQHISSKYGSYKNYINNITSNIEDNRYININNYIKQIKDIDYYIFKNRIINREYGEFLMFQNFLDAYSKGKLNMYFNNTSFKYLTSTHDKRYFGNTKELIVEELLANYIGLKKSSKGIYYINILKDMFSEEFINLLDMFYYQMDKKIDLKYKV